MGTRASEDRAGRKDPRRGAVAAAKRSPRSRPWRRGEISGIDYSPASVATARATNAKRIAAGQVDIQRASVSALPFPDGRFDLATAIETHYYWPDLPHDLREISRVLVSGGRLMILAEAYRGAREDWVTRPIMGLLGGRLLTPAEHRELFAGAGFVEVEVHEDRSRGWLEVIGRKPPSDVAEDARSTRPFGRAIRIKTPSGNTTSRSPVVVQTCRPERSHTPTADVTNVRWNCGRCHIMAGDAAGMAAADSHTTPPCPDCGISDHETRPRRRRLSHNSFVRFIFIIADIHRRAMTPGAGSRLMLRSALAVTAFVTIVHVGTSAAQTSGSSMSASQMSDSLRSALGARIRLYTVSSEPVWIRGTLMSVSDSVITLQDARGSRPIDLSDIQAAERFTGQPRWEGALVGLAFGIGAGAIIGRGIGTSDDHSKEFAGLGGFLGGIEGGMIGAVIGPIGGALLTPESWQVLIPHR